VGVASESTSSEQAAVGERSAAPPALSQLDSPNASDREKTTSPASASFTPATGSRTPPFKPASPADDRRGTFDPVEDGLVEQREMERDMDSAFVERRLLHEAEEADAGVRAELQADSLPPRDTDDSGEDPLASLAAASEASAVVAEAPCAEAAAGNEAGAGGATGVDAGAGETPEVAISAEVAEVAAAATSAEEATPAAAQEALAEEVPAAVAELAGAAGVTADTAVVVEEAAPAAAQEPLVEEAPDAHASESQSPQAVGADLDTSAAPEETIAEPACSAAPLEDEPSASAAKSPC